MPVAFFGILLAIAAEPATHAGQVQSKTATGPEIATRVKANLVSLFSTDDYPPEAWRNGEQGTVGVRLTVDATGKVADCVVLLSSGSPALDVQTCRILWSRAQFVPARDAKGNAVQDTYTQRIRWELPTTNRGDVEEQFSRFILTVDAEKTIVDCRFEASPDWQKEDSGCTDFIERMRNLVTYAPDTIDFTGKDLILETQHRVGRADSGIELGEREGETSLAVSRLYLAIDSAGKVKSCSRDSWGPVRSDRMTVGCGAAELWQFHALPAAETNRNDRELTVVNAIYLRPKLPAAAGN